MKAAPPIISDAPQSERICVGRPWSGRPWVWDLYRMVSAPGLDPAKLDAIAIVADDYADALRLVLSHTHLGDRAA